MRRDVSDLTPIESRVSEIVQAETAILPSELVERIESDKVSSHDVRGAIRHMVQDGLLRFRYDARVVSR